MRDVKGEVTRVARPRIIWRACCLVIELGRFWVLAGQRPTSHMDLRAPRDEIGHGDCKATTVGGAGVDRAGCAVAGAILFVFLDMVDDAVGFIE